MPEPKKFTLDFQNRTLKFEVGQVAGQASGSVLASYGDTVVLATVVMADKPKEGANFLPLSVEYEERLYAAGKIKGSRFIKREGRPMDDAILKGRMIDRSIRPRFDQRIRNDIQLVVTVLCYDQENDPEVLGLIAASMALSISNIPWSGPLAAVKMGWLDNQLIVNPTFPQQQKSELALIVAGTESKINMLEAGANQISEEIFLAAIDEAQKQINQIITFEKKVIDELKPQKMELKLAAINPEVQAKVKEFLKDKIEPAIYNKDKIAVHSKLGTLEFELQQLFGGEKAEKALMNQVMEVFEEEINILVHENILKNNKRPDGRGLDEVRQLTCQTGFLPRTHGSALFQRGETQALSVVTLGPPSAEQIIETLQPEYKKHYIHHYNFPPFSVGETGRLGGPGRREVGHGALAERALEPLIPGKKEFPYTIRVVSEILSSNGSSSMASVCGSSMALMDAGVPIKEAAAGIAMGLMIDPSTSSGQAPKYKVLTDIQGPEDHHGDMDFKVAGTKNGVTGVQMDVKVEGVTLPMLKDAFEQTKQARLHILGEMTKAISAPRPELSKYAPRIITFQIDKEKIREVIGPGGKIINEIIAQTGVEIDIEDSGMIFITSVSAEAAQKALEWINNITREVQPGEIFQGRVTRIMNFGAFVEILPGQEGLVHISQLAPYRVNKVEDVVKIGDIIAVKVMEIDDKGRINLTTKDATNNDRE